VDRPIRIGVSSCLLGEEVRFDGGHKRDDFLVDVFGPHVEWIPVCPEVEIGLGVPREPIRLERRDGLVHLIAAQSRRDHAQTMRLWSRRRLSDLARDELSGYVLKSKSPSCGMHSVPIYGENGILAQRGRGLFAEALLEEFPNLPVEEERRLNDPVVRGHFIECVFAYHRLRGLFHGRWRMRDVVEFHAAHKLLLMAHSIKHYRALTRLAAEIRTAPRWEFRSRYEAGFMEAMRGHATAAKHARVLGQIARDLAGCLDREERKELLEIILDYSRGRTPLLAPLTLIRHYAWKYQLTDLHRQAYLQPDPKEWILRNRV
jgi:uncharacterized protein YbbK (DUF523 family)/uncharacterized protein YbgA (DUF1722 family)